MPAASSPIEVGLGQEVQTTAFNLCPRPTWTFHGSSALFVVVCGVDIWYRAQYELNWKVSQVDANNCRATRRGIQKYVVRRGASDLAPVLELLALRPSCPLGPSSSS